MNVTRNVDTDKWAYVFSFKQKTKTFKKLATNKGLETDLK